MKDIKVFDQVQMIADHEDMTFFYASDLLSIVCQDMLPQVEALAKEIDMPIYNIDITDMPMARGQLNLHTAPVVMLYRQGREVYRQGRFLDLEELKEVVEDYRQR